MSSQRACSVCVVSTLYSYNRAKPPLLLSNYFTCVTDLTLYTKKHTLKVCFLQYSCPRTNCHDQQSNWCLVRRQKYSILDC